VSQSATPTISCFSPLTLPIEARFDGPQLTSDGGLVWLAEADATLGLCRALAAQIPEWRIGPARHSLETLVRQRIFQIACGYEDQDDADTLRSDPLLKLLTRRVSEYAARDHTVSGVTSCSRSLGTMRVWRSTRVRGP
jgi:Transposase DDE domain group 1